MSGVVWVEGVWCGRRGGREGVSGVGMSINHEHNLTTLSSVCPHQSRRSIGRHETLYSLLIVSPSQSC